MRRLDELSAREREVIDLLRVGLTNEEIARRLGISLAGAKYHVSQILSKLGVSSREEAVALTQERRPWWSRALGWSLAAKGAGAAVVVGAAVGVGVLVWGVLVSGGSEQEGQAEVQPQTLEDVYARALASISRPGSILHATIAYSEVTTRGGNRLTPTTEMWIDGEADAVRMHLIGIAEGEVDDSESLIVGRFQYLIQPPLNPGDQTRAERDDFKQLCPGSDRAAIAVLFGCYGQAQQGNAPATPRIEAEEFEGRQAVALVASATFGSGTNSFEARRTLYLDPATLLPIASVDEARSKDRSGNPTIGRYSSEFLDRSQVSADFFNPRTVGYGLENAGELLDALARKTPVYWLGEEHEFDANVCTVPHAGNCPLVLRQVISNPASGSEGLLVYNYNEVMIELWKPGYLDEFANSPGGRLLANPRCAAKTDVPLGNQSAVIYALPPVNYPLVTPPPEDPCSARFPATRGGPIFDGVIALVDFGDVVVEVNGPPPGAYASREAVEAVVKALQRR